MTTQSKTELIDQAIKDLDGDISKVAMYGWDGHTYLAYNSAYGANYVVCHYNSAAVADGLCFCTIEEFEQRKKELEQMNNSWYDYRKQIAVGLPPIGEIVLYDDSEKGLIQVEIIGHHPHYQDVVWSEAVDKGFSGGFDYSTDGNYLFRPLDWDKLSKRKQAIAYAMELSPDWAKLEDIFGSLYDAGVLKLPENKA